VDYHVQEDLVLVQLAFQLLYLLLPISGGHSQFVDLLGQIYLSELFAKILLLHLILVSLIVL